MDWLDYELLAEKERIDKNFAQTITKLFDEENTIPFLCRYRKNLIQNTPPEKLREIQESLNTIRELQTKVTNFLKSLDKKEGVESSVKEDAKGIKSLEELNFYKSLFKSEGKRSLYERAVEGGFEPLTQKILSGDTVKLTKESTKGVHDIIVHFIVKNKLIMEEIRKLKEKYSVRIEAKKLKEDHKFETYYQFSCSSNVIKPHQILAIFRGEAQKVLKISYNIDDRVSRDLLQFSSKILLKSTRNLKIFKNAFDEAFSKRILTFLKRQLKNDLLKFAEKAAISSFAENLKNLLLTRPIRGRKILGIDPGFKHGCKIALISEHGDLIDTKVIFLHEKKEMSKKVLANLLESNKCDLIALGNGTACRETENFINEVIEELDGVEYCIVSEQGSSIFSCTEIAKKEFPGEKKLLKGDTNFLFLLHRSRYKSN